MESRKEFEDHLAYQIRTTVLESSEVDKNYTGRKLLARTPALAVKDITRAKRRFGSNCQQFS